MSDTLHRVGQRIVKVVLAGLLALTWLAEAEAARARRPEDLVDAFVGAWNSHDMKAFADLFADDADFVNVAGMWWKGRAEIQTRHEESHATRFETSSLARTGTAVRMPRADVAVIHFSWELTGQIDREGKPLPPRRGILQMVAVKQGDGWRIIAAQNTNAAAAR